MIDMETAYSGMAGRYVAPGERCHIVDEFGYWRREAASTFLGTSRGGYFVHYREDGGQERMTTYHVIRGLLPCATVDCRCAEESK